MRFCFLMIRRGWRIRALPIARRLGIINYRVILGRWRISVLGIFLNGGFSMGERVGCGISGKDCGIGGLLTGR